MAVQYLRARLNGQPLPQVQANAPSPSTSLAPDAAHAGNEQPQPDAAKAAKLLDDALASAAVYFPGGKMPQRQPLWLVECGNFSANVVAFPGLRTVTHLEALKQMGCVAAVPGSAELQLKPDQAQEFFAANLVPIVSCNLQVETPGAGIQPFIKLAPGWYLTGVTTWTPATGQPPQDRWWELTDAVESVRSVKKELPKSARLIVIAAYQPDAVVSEIAKLAAVVVANPVPGLPAGAIILPPPAPKAQYLTLATLSSAGKDLTDVPWQVMLSDVWPDDTQVVALFKEEYKRIRERILGVRAGEYGKDAWKKMEWKQSDKFLPSKSGATGAGGAPATAGTTSEATATASAGPQLIGAASCKECHAAAYTTWMNTPHAKALVSLRTADDKNNLDCLRCHTTGLMQPGGYDPFAVSPVLGEVGCEACHGPGSAHALRMKGVKPGSAKAKALRSAAGSGGLDIQRNDKSGCLACHDKYNSPKFDAEVYWGMVKH